MYQSFDLRSTPQTGPARLSDLRAAMAHAGLDGFLVPRADRHQGENVAPCDERLAWLTGFTGSAGLCAALTARAALFVDGRYTLQASSQVDGAAFEIVPSPEVKLSDWLADALADGAVLGYDPWLHGREQITELTAQLTPKGITLRASENLIDAVWADRPAPPMAPVRVHDPAFGGAAHDQKRRRIAAALGKDGVDAAVLTLPDSIAWLLNIRGGDIARTPVPHAFAILRADGAVSLFSDLEKFDATVRSHLGNAVDIQSWSGFEPALAALTNAKVAVDPASAPMRVGALLAEAGAEIRWQRDPCMLPKACKSATELAGIRAAHLRDGAAMARFLHWLDSALAQGQALTEIDVVRALEGFRVSTGALRDISFETICGAGPNGAIVHYRVTEATNRAILPGDILLVDSGGQYEDGTTDITRTMATGPVDAAAATAFTLVLRGMIAISLARFPVGLAGRDIDALARAALWQAGFDYAHGTGHGVGAYLGVHEGPQSLSRRGTVPFEPGMVLSNEPGFYREGAFGIRIENLLAVLPPAIPDEGVSLEGGAVLVGGGIPMLGFETLTLCPIDRRLVRPALMTAAELAWLNAYHARVAAALTPLLPADTAAWLADACAPVPQHAPV
ncbi:MAG: aminopeptidase P family protein [Pseudomonadota bacterium]